MQVLLRLAFLGAGSQNARRAHPHGSRPRSRAASGHEMVGTIATDVRIKDPANKMVPPAALLALSIAMSAARFAVLRATLTQAAAGTTGAECG